VDKGEKTMVAKRMHAIRKAFILEIYVTNMVMLSSYPPLFFIATMIFSSIRRELFLKLSPHVPKIISDYKYNLKNKKIEKKTKHIINLKKIKKIIKKKTRNLSVGFGRLTYFVRFPM
jgi:hypothetical protein